MFEILTLISFFLYISIGSEKGFDIELGYEEDEKDE